MFVSSALSYVSKRASDETKHPDRPITTYAGQGCQKSGCDAQTHAIVHVEGEIPQCTGKELDKGLTKEPLSIVPSSTSIKLDKMARVNFAQAYTVDHTALVKNMGLISARSAPKLRSYWAMTMSG